MATTLILLPTTIHTHHLHHHHNNKNNNNTIFTSHKPKLIKFQSFLFPLKKHIIFNCLPPSQPQTQTQNPPRTNLFLTNEEYQKLQNLNNFTYSCKIPSGYLTIRPMKEPELDITVGLLAESFAESMFLPDDMYVKLLSFLIKQYMVERRGLMPHAVTLLGFFREVKNEGEGENVACDDVEGEFAGSVEVTFNKLGANNSLPSPTPPKDCPYICNMSVKKHLRRRGIGWHLLKASEELISKMSSSRDVYLHCRMIDVAPFKMYTKAGYDVVKTDSYLILLTLQRRKHLMCKKLPELTESSEVNIDAENGSFSMVRRESEILSCDEKSLGVGKSVSASE